MKSGLRIAMVGFATIASTLLCSAANDAVAFGNDGIDRADPNFVTASILVMSPGDELYSSMGHSCFRLECPTFKLDYCFSYESESAKGRMLELLSGKLKMGMFSVPTQEYLKTYAQEGRRVVQYRLNLPPDVKQRLWKALDEQVAAGIELPYDVLRRGCTQSMVMTLRQVLPPHKLIVMEWPSKYDSDTRRELVEAVVNDRPWTRLFLHTLSGMELDRPVSRFDKIVVPDDLVQLLRLARIGNRRVITQDAVELLPLHNQPTSKVVPPIVVSMLVVALMTMNVFVKVPWLDIVFVGFQSLFGVGLMYLVFMSDLFGTNWNWLLIPFNILPLIFWKWRAKWALWFAAVLALWEIVILAWPSRLTDPAYLVLVAAYIVMFARIGWQGMACRSAIAAKPVTRDCADIFNKLCRANEAVRKGLGC